MRQYNVLFSSQDFLGSYELVRTPRKLCQPAVTEPELNSDMPPAICNTLLLQMFPNCREHKI